MRIGICGSQSVGKSTLVNALSKHSFFKDYTFIAEKTKELISKGVPANKESTSDGQDVFMLEGLKNLDVENSVMDRTIIDVYTFTKLAETIPAEKKELFDRLKDILLEKYDLIFYIPIVDEVKMEDNGIRETDEQFRKDVDKILKYEFDRLPVNKRHYITSISLNGRIEEVIMVCERVMRDKNDKN